MAPKHRTQENFKGSSLLKVGRCYSTSSPSWRKRTFVKYYKQNIGNLGLLQS